MKQGTKRSTNVLIWRVYIRAKNENVSILSHRINSKLFIRHMLRIWRVYLYVCRSILHVDFLESTLIVQHYPDIWNKHHKIITPWKDVKRNHALQRFNWETFKHPPKSSDMFLYDFHICGVLEEDIRRHRFSLEKVEKLVKLWICKQHTFFWPTF